MKKMTRRSFLCGAAVTAALPLVSGLPARSTAQQAGSKPFAGKTLNVFMFDHPYPRALKDLLPQFTERTGIKVEMETPSFIVYNQRADLELSTGSGAFDVMSMTFIFSGKWIGAGWASKLNEFIAKDTTLDVADFLPGAMAPMKGGNDVMALPFVAESTLMVYRTDVLKRAGVKPPETFDELLAVAPKIQSADVKAYMGRGLGGVHWI
jgi:multiple sugar transport system substrate-binding protein